MSDIRRGLYLITPDWTDTDRLLQAVEAGLAGGAVLLQYRNKVADAPLRREQAAALLPLCRARGVPLIINDAAAEAVAVGADGVHLGRDDGDPAAARALLPPGSLLGVSCYDELARALAGARAGADYLAFGAVFPSATKPGAVRAPLALFARTRAALQQQGVPVPALCAIGGISLERAPEVVAAGADLLAVISDVFDAADVRRRVAAYTALF